MRLSAVVAMGLALLVSACTPKPTDNDVRTVLQQNLPASAKAGVNLDSIQSEVSASGEEQLVKFKAALKTSEPLFTMVDFEEAARSAGADPAGFEQVGKALDQLTQPSRDRFAADAAAAGQKAVFLKVAIPPGTATDWYGSFKAKKVVDRWVTSELRTDVEPKLSGQPRSAFPGEALKIEDAKAWFAQARAKQDSLLQRLSDAKALEEKQEQLEQQAAAAQQARQEKDALLAEQNRRARQLPLRAQMTKAVLGNSKVLLLQVARPITVQLDVVRGAQNFSRQLQVQPGRTLPFGHLEGWGFQSGDRVTLSNPNFDPLTFTVP